MNRRHTLTQVLVHALGGLALTGGCSENAAPATASEDADVTPMPCSLESPCPVGRELACYGTSSESSCDDEFTCQLGVHGGCGAALVQHCGCDGRLYESSTCPDRPSQPLSECPLVECDASLVTCDAPTPTCEGEYSVPSVEAGCWSRCVNPVQCR